MMEHFRRELVDTSLHCGVDNIAELEPEHVRPATLDHSTSE
jgi:hypothetical protein